MSPNLSLSLCGTYRCSSIQLLGDLLYKISGLSGKMSTESEEDDNFGTEAAHQTLLKSLGKERRDRVLAGLYMGRCSVGEQLFGLPWLHGVAVVTSIFLMLIV